VPARLASARRDLLRVRVTYDVCVYGGIAGGVTAAVAAARQGKTVVLVNPGRHLGGLTSGGLGATDIGNEAVVGGLARDVYRRIGRAYGRDEVFRFEPHVAERVFETLSAEAHLSVVPGRRVTAVRAAGGRISSLQLDDGGAIEARAFIDSSYEGDVMALAGVRYAVGREPVAQYGESLNGVRAETPHHQFEAPVDPFVTSGDPRNGLLPCVQDEAPGEAGRGDGHIQAYNFRLCLTRAAGNRRPLDPPSAYDPRRYEILGRYFAALVAAGRSPRFSDFFLIVEMPNGKTDFNNRGGFSTDHIGANWEYPDGDHATRDRIWRDHESYTRGIFHFLRTDPRVPANVRREAEAWGLCRDEFPDTGGWPHQLYVREGRRMLGRYVVTQADCQGARRADDAVGMGAYTMDSHNIRRIVHPDGPARPGALRNEGDVQIGVAPYPISYRAITPRAEECRNLLVPVCLSATHIAHGSIRMEPVFMVLGESAGVAACRALDAGKDVQEVDVAALQRDLRQMGQILEFTPPTGPREWAHHYHIYESETSS
ncbi:MAG: FAD-dependent oxidoreductase, partial [bacterium]